MWTKHKFDQYDVWKNKVCKLYICTEDTSARIYIDYKGYNPLLIMGLSGFEEEVQQRGIEYDVEGKQGKYKSLYYVVNLNSLRLFCDMIYFFLEENNIDNLLTEEYKLE